MRRNEVGEASRTRPTSTVSRQVEVLQDLYWDEAVAAAMTSDRFGDIEPFRETIIDEAFVQPSFQTRHRYASYFIKWFMPSLSFDDPVPLCWRAFHEKPALEHVMRWQYVSSNPLIASYVDDHLSHVPPGEPVDEGVDAFLAGALGGVNDKSRNRMKANLRKVGLLVSQSKRSFRIVPEVSNESVALLLAILFAPEAMTLSFLDIVRDPWWKRLGVESETALRQKLQDTANAGLIARSLRMDTLDQVTTRYSIDQFRAGKARSK
jgi:hypothetical protein